MGCLLKVSITRSSARVFIAFKVASGSSVRNARARRAAAKLWRRCNSKQEQSRICGGGWIGARSFTLARSSTAAEGALATRERANSSAGSPASTRERILLSAGVSRLSSKR
ncbi:hypothetical protein D3C76_1234840 [compost metagenome]